MDPTGVLLPDWCFFAPEPAQHDYRLLYRVVDIRGAVSAWRWESGIAERRWYHALWCPQRRSDKALFDACAEFLEETAAEPRRAVRAPAHTALRELTRDRVRHHEDLRTQAFQFALVRCPGYAELEPEFLYLSHLCVLRRGTDGSPEARSIP
ncbi:hypothetical protein FHR84_003268 [Actinopolyspora biskrensis]|uniref:Uncharacterized protein n=1 Tax=Actinopolyspora biskrensis TaxID=1470178 RepID=A0A852Z2D2_9ACTN|nr:hypothetical protein [Actinopolyspora biskrensis]NYH79919.1 hypothetical protein [Actinopolyspora biskrensis]